MALCYVTVWLYFMSQYGSILCNIVAPSDISVSLSMLRHNMALCYVLTWLFVTSQYGSMIRNSITPTAAVAAACVPRCSRGRDGHEGGGGVEQLSDYGSNYLTILANTGQIEPNQCRERAFLTYLTIYTRGMFS